jgi:phospholipid/cholesterol/gamma-HCH transport system substrate-binding protein
MKKLPTRRISSPFLVGLFSILAVGLAIGVVLWLGANQFLKEQKLYVTYFETSVEGLEQGSPVKYQGVPVGAVHKIQVAPDGRMLEVIMQIDNNVNIDDSLRIKMELAGIAGGKFLQMYYPTDHKIAILYPVLTFQPLYPVIKSSPSAIQEFENAARDVINNLLQLQVAEISQGTVDFLNSSTKFFNSKELYNILKSIDSAGISLANILKQAETTDVLSNLSTASKTLMQTSNDLKHFSEALNTKLADINIKDNITHVVARYDSLLMSTQRAIDIITTRSESAVFGVTEAIEEIRSTSRQLKKSLKLFTENPGQLLLSEPPPPDK